MVVCLERGADLHVAQLMPLLLTVSYFSKIQIGFTFLVPAHLGSPGKGPLNGCACVRACVRACVVQRLTCHMSIMRMTNHKRKCDANSAYWTGLVGILSHCSTYLEIQFDTRSLWFWSCLSEGRSGQVVSASDCGIRGPRFECHGRQLCLSRRRLWHAPLALTAYTFTAVPRLTSALHPSVVNRVPASAGVKAGMSPLPGGR